MMREFVIRAAKGMTELELIKQLEEAIKLYKGNASINNKSTLELFNYMLAIKLDSLSADEMISKLSEIERTQNFFTTYKN